MDQTPYSEKVIKAHQKGSIYIHGISETNRGYSTAFSLKQLIEEEFKPGKRSKTLKKVLNELQVLIKNACREWYGPIAFNSFDSHLAQILCETKISSFETRRQLEIFMAQLNTLEQKTLIVISLDISPIKEEELYPEMLTINDELYSIIKHAYVNGQHNPLPIINIREETNWEDPGLKKFIALSYLFGIPQYVNYYTGTLIRNHLWNIPKSKPDPNVIYLKHGGILGNGDNRGQIGVVTVNLPRLAFQSKNEDEFFERLTEVTWVASTALEEKRKHLEERMSRDLMPVSKRFMESLDWHFSSITITGANEALMNLIGAGTDHVAGKAVTYKLLEHMMKLIEELQSETGQIYSLGAYPSERPGAYMAMIDHEHYPDLLTSGEVAPYYTGSTELPPNHGDDLWDALEHQKKYHGIYNGSTVFQIHLNRGINYREEAKLLLKRCIEQFGCNSIKVSPLYSLCRRHGYVYGETKFCPICGEKTLAFTWIDGQAKAVETLYNGLKEEKRQRVRYDVKNN